MSEDHGNADESARPRAAPDGRELQHLETLLRRLTEGHARVAGGLAARRRGELSPTFSDLLEYADTCRRGWDDLALRLAAAARTHEGASVRALARIVGVSHATLYRQLREHNDQESEPEGERR